MPGIVTTVFQADLTNFTGQNGGVTNWGPHQRGSNIYVVLTGFASTDPPELIRVFRSDDDSATWTELDSANAPGHEPSTAVAILRLGDVLYIAYSSPGVVELGVQTFDMVTELWGTEDLGGPPDVSAACIGVFTGGDLAVFSNQATDGFYATRLSGVWSASLQYSPVDPDAAITNANSVLVDGSNVIHVFYSTFLNSGDQKYYHQTLDSSGTLSTAQLVQTDTAPLHGSLWGYGTISGTSMVVPFDQAITVSPSVRQVNAYVSDAVSDAPSWTRNPVAIETPGSTPMFAFLDGTAIVIMYLAGGVVDINANYQIAFSTSTDGVTWSDPTIFYDSLTDPPDNVEEPGFLGFSALFAGVDHVYGAVITMFSNPDVLPTAYVVGPALVGGTTVEPANYWWSS